MNNPSQMTIMYSEFPLKPCPFCGTVEVFLIRVSDFCGNGDAYYVACPNCNANQFPDVMERAIHDWNQRREPRKPSKEALPA